MCFMMDVVKLQVPTKASGKRALSLGFTIRKAKFGFAKSERFV